MDNFKIPQVQLRRLHDADAVSQFYEILSDASIYTYITAPAPRDINEFLGRHRPTPSNMVFGAYFRAEDENHVGLLEIRLDDMESASIGYFVGVTYWGKGFASAMIHLATEEARTMGLRKIFGIADSRNTASIRALERNGFVRNGERLTMLKMKASTDIVLSRVL